MAGIRVCLSQSESAGTKPMPTLHGSTATETMDRSTTRTITALAHKKLTGRLVAESLWHRLQQGLWHDNVLLPSAISRLGGPWGGDDTRSAEWGVYCMSFCPARITLKCPRGPLDANAPDGKHLESPCVACAAGAGLSPRAHPGL